MTAAFWLGFQAGLAVAAIVLVLLGTCAIARRLQEAGALCDRLLSESAERGSAVLGPDVQKVANIGLPDPPDILVYSANQWAVFVYHN